MGYVILPDGQLIIMGFVPKITLSIISLACWTALTIAYWSRFFYHGRHKYMLTLCIGTTTMAIGFGLRIPITNAPGSIGLYIAMDLLIVLSPCAFLANAYLILPRIASYIDEERQMRIPSRKLAKYFLWSDFITFNLQGGGSGLTSGTKSPLPQIGNYITLVGLIAQSISFFFFLFVTLVFGMRVRKRTNKWTNRSSLIDATSFDLGDVGQSCPEQRIGMFNDWRVLYIALIVNGIGMTIRCIYRVVEYAQGTSGLLLNHEIYMYLLDTLPLFLAGIIWAVFWPPTYLRMDSSPFPRTSVDQSVEMGDRSGREVEEGDGEGGRKRSWSSLLTWPVKSV
ncbi:hypothetical protein CI109_107057 [Kwoniella shandongensis]|uniref:Uncharacterized protein n=1 Tax=Kwoniella shandongensis TaxID=1734106 RepID=A0A5M6BR09_9TREE|nr:uncharacterized protein CI109_006466 [Kwoniella shandongensis]KAA5525197.1 hypothetical protein CI109_006466 [Kwoniella shandongensis]